MIGVPHEKWGETVLAVVVLHDHRQATPALEAEIIDFTKDRMAGFKRPRKIVFVADAEMPRTATGKILHRTLRDRMAATST